MQLHRIEGAPEWAAVRPEDRNGWQRVAAATNSIITIGNLFSVIGLASVPYGLWLLNDGHIAAGILVLMAGRACDLLDGWLADMTGTKSPLGEKVDASFDKLSTAAAFGGAWVLGLVDWRIVIALLVPQAAAVVIVLVAQQRRKRLHPSQVGKVGMALTWGALLAFLIIGSLDAAGGAFGQAAAGVLLGAAVSTSSFAAIGYWREISGSKPSPNS